MAQTNPQLMDWASLQTQHDWSGILVGNGASRVLWDEFKYQSLYQVASSGNVEYRLTPADQQIFREMDTTNFELVLAGLVVSQIVCDALDIDSGKIKARYESIRRALLEAVAVVHIPWTADDSERYTTVREALRLYEFVYSTNYDLIVYWAVMAKGGSGFKDYFWGDSFNITNTDVWDDDVTKVLYMHGGIHLVRFPSGGTCKRRAGSVSNLLTSLAFLNADGGVPLFITEGASKDKLSSIYRSDYLAFAYQQFLKHEGPLVVFGHSLGESDQHLVDAMGKWGSRKIAISVYPGDGDEIADFMTNLRQRLPRAELLFFDSRTHPLGADDLRIERKTESTAGDGCLF